MPSKSLPSWSATQHESASPQETNRRATRLGAPLLTARQASEYLQVTVSTLAVWRCTNRVHLPFVKVGGGVRYRLEDIHEFLTGRPHAASARTDNLPSRTSRAAAPSVAQKAAKRLEEFKENHGALKCERCNVQVEEAEARIGSHLELPSLEGPRDPHDWHCFCATCHQVLTQQPGVLRGPKTLFRPSGSAASLPSQMPRLAP